MRYLIVKLSAIGDCICTLPLLTRLRRADPAARIDWLVEDRCAPVLADHPLLDALVVVRRRSCRGWGDRLRVARQLVRRLRLGRYDVALDVQGLLKSAWAPALAGIPDRCGYDDAREGSRWLYRRRFRHAKAALHAVDRNLALLQDAMGWSGPAPAARPDEFVLARPPHAVAAVDRWLARQQVPETGFAMFNISAGKPTNRWMTDRFGALAAHVYREHGLTVLLGGAPADRPRAAEVAAAAAAHGAPEATRDACGAVDLQGLVELLRRAAVLVSGDSGPMHLASALGCPLVTLFGSSDPFRTGPYLGRRTTLLQEPVACAPCFKKRCPNPPQEQLICLQALTVEGVGAALAGQLAAGRTDETPGRGPWLADAARRPG